jgi:hypothetical protein
MMVAAANRNAHSTAASDGSVLPSDAPDLPMTMAELQNELLVARCAVLAARRHLRALRRRCRSMAGDVRTTQGLLIHCALASGLAQAILAVAGLLIVGLADNSGSVGAELAVAGAAAACLASVTATHASMFQPFVPSDAYPRIAAALRRLDSLEADPATIAGARSLSDQRSP